MSTRTEPAFTGVSPAFIALFLLATAMTTLTLAGTAPILPMLQAHFSNLEMAASLSRATVTIGAIGIVIGAPLTGVAASLCGRKVLLIGAAGLFTLAGVTGCFVDNLIVIVASRFIVGLTAALVTTLTVTIVGEAYDEAGRNRWMGLMVAGGTFLTMLLIPLVGVLGDIGWREAFLIHLIGIPITLLAWLGYRHTEQIATVQPAASIPLRFDLIALGLSTGIAINAQSIYAPFKLDAIGVQSATMIGLAMMPLTFMAAIVSPFYGRLRKHASAALVFGVGFACLGGGLALFVAAPNFAVALCGYGLFGAALGVVMSNMYVVGAQADMPEHRAAALGQTLAGFYLSLLVAQVLLEPLIDGKPTHALIWLAGFSGALSVVWLIFSACANSRAASSAA